MESKSVQQESTAFLNADVELQALGFDPAKITIK
jgi:hypothetical protein